VALTLLAGLVTARPAAARQTDEIVPLTFPVLGKVNWVDSFNPDGLRPGWRIHHGEDLMAAKMTPLVAAMDGTVYLMRTPGHNMLSIQGDNGYTGFYCHINDDTPGTHDHNGSDDYAYAPGLKSGDHVLAGQLVAWVGDSGNARGGPPHCHFELTQSGRYLNPAPSLRAARRLKEPVVVLAQAQLRPGLGEIRLDGEVRSCNGGKTLVLRVLACTDGKGHTTPVSHPLHRWVTLEGTTTLRRRDTPDQPLTPADLKTGLPIFVIGPDRGKDHAVPARLAAIEPAPAPQQVAAAERWGGKRFTGLPGFDTTAAQSPSTHSLFRQTRRAAQPVVIARTLSDAETRLVALINDYRRELDLPPLQLDARLSQAAWQQSRDMVAGNLTGHLGVDGSTLLDRLNLVGYDGFRAVESVCVNEQDPQSVLRAWLTRNPEDRRNLLNPALRYMGVAHVSISAGEPQPNQVVHAWTLVLAAP
jgi:uncharacterized protein YkwD